MKIIWCSAIVAFFFLAEESIMSDIANVGEVTEIHVDENLIDNMSRAITDNINTEDWSQNDLKNVVRAANQLVNAAIDPLIQYVGHITDYSKEMAKTYPNGL